ncbi:MAG TPA: chorismate mutase [Methylocella sp.]|nr:chorismate mutase [Methylocella sp.]
MSRLKMIDPSCLETLADLRIEIDRIDAALHQLLMERGEIIHRLIEAKARQGGGLAFRPGREADMMRALVSRHRGLLPLDTVESIWRIIISTFTFVQSNYSVHADISGGDAAMRDCCRFHFGFTVPYIPHQGAARVIEAVAKSGGDLGVVRVLTPEGPWWRGLAKPGAPKIIARLPFVERPDHPAGMPVFIIAQPLAEAAVHDVVLYDVEIPDNLEYRAHPGPLGPGVEILNRFKAESGLRLMIAAEAGNGLAEWRETLIRAGAAEPRITEIGSHAARFDASSIQKVAAQ